MCSEGNTCINYIKSYEEIEKLEINKRRIMFVLKLMMIYFVISIGNKTLI